MSMVSIFFFLAVLALALWSIFSTLIGESERILAAMAGPQATPVLRAGVSNVIVFTRRPKGLIEMDRIAA